MSEVKVRICDKCGKPTATKANPLHRFRVVRKATGKQSSRSVSVDFHRKCAPKYLKPLLPEEAAPATPVKPRCATCGGGVNKADAISIGKKTYHKAHAPEDTRTTS